MHKKKCSVFSLCFSHRSAHSLVQFCNFTWQYLKTTVPRPEPLVTMKLPCGVGYYMVEFGAWTFIFGCYASPDLHQDTVLKLEQQKKNWKQEKNFFWDFKTSILWFWICCTACTLREYDFFWDRSWDHSLQQLFSLMPFFFNKDESYSFLQEEI